MGQVTLPAIATMALSLAHVIATWQLLPARIATVELLPVGAFDLFAFPSTDTFNGLHLLAINATLRVTNILAKVFPTFQYFTTSLVAAKAQC